MCEKAKLYQNAKINQDMKVRFVWCKCCLQHLFKFRLEGHQKPRNEVGSLKMAKHQLSFEPETF